MISTKRYPLRDLRKTHKLTQDQLAKFCKTSRERISLLENGHQIPRLEMQGRLALALGVPLSKLQAHCNWPETPHFVVRGLEVK